MKRFVFLLLAVLAALALSAPALSARAASGGAGPRACPDSDAPEGAALSRGDSEAKMFGSGTPDGADLRAEGSGVSRRQGGAKGRTAAGVEYWIYALISIFSVACLMYLIQVLYRERKKNGTRHK